MEVEHREREHAANLGKVDHVVVIMLENRSFDHMPGYLSLTGRRPDIDGLRREFANKHEEFANKHEGRTYPFHHLGTTALELDPDHSAAGIDAQVAGGAMAGFVASAAATLARTGDGGGDPACVMWAAAVISDSGLDGFPMLP